MTTKLQPPPSAAAMYYRLLNKFSPPLIFTSMLSRGEVVGIWGGGSPRRLALGVGVPALEELGLAAEAGAAVALHLLKVIAERVDAMLMMLSWSLGLESIYRKVTS